jgi:hypothetical protein
MEARPVQRCGETEGRKPSYGSRNLYEIPHGCVVVRGIQTRRDSDRREVKLDVGQRRF